MRPPVATTHKAASKNVSLPPGLIEATVEAAWKQRITFSRFVQNALAVATGWQRPERKKK